MKDELVKFETAKLAKQKGFKDEYWGDNTVVNWNKEIVGIKPFFGFVSRPTQSLLQKWLREVHYIYVFVSKIGLNVFQVTTYLYGAKAYEIIHPNIDLDDNQKDFNTYEKALEVGLKEGLKLIK